MIRITVEQGQEVIETVTTYLKKYDVKEGVIVSVIGALDTFCLSTMSKTDAKKVIAKEYHEPVELTGTGEITDGKPHIHAVVGREDQTALMGHLEWGKVKDWFVHVYVMPHYTIG